MQVLKYEQIDDHFISSIGTFSDVVKIKESQNCEKKVNFSLFLLRYGCLPWDLDFTFLQYFAAAGGYRELRKMLGLNPRPLAT